MGHQWWWGAVGAAVVVGCVVVRSPADRTWRSYVLEIVAAAGWMLVVMFLIKPLVPANVFGVAILVLAVSGILAVPLIARYKARRNDSQERSSGK